MKAEKINAIITAVGNAGFTIKNFNVNTQVEMGPNGTQVSTEVLTISAKIDEEASA